MLKPKQFFGLVYMSKIPINITSKKVDLSLKKLGLGLEKILRMRNLSVKLKKQRQPFFSLKRLRLIRPKKIYYHCNCEPK